MTILKSKTALVLGGSGGIGRAVVEELSGAGARVTAVGRSAEVLAAISSATGCEAKHGDLNDETFQNEIATLANGSDILISAIGVAIPEPLLATDLDHWRTMFETNLFSVVAISLAAANGMKERGSGDIVHVGSILSRGVAPNSVGYAASKHALAAFTMGLRQDLFGTGIRVVEVSPGLVGGTEFHRHATHPALQGSFSTRPYTPIGTQDVARCVRAALELPPNTEVTQLEVRPLGHFYQA